VEALSSEYNFSASEASSKLNLLGLKVSVGGGRKERKSVEKAPQDKTAFPLPFSGRNVEECCQSLRQNQGLYTQCRNSKAIDDFCKSCSSKMVSGVPEYGTMSQRLAVGLNDYVDPSGRKVVHYTKLMKKHKVSEEDVLAEARKFGQAVDACHFVQPESDSVKRGRPKAEKAVKVSSGVKGRPKKTKKVVEIDGEEDDLFASLVAQSINESVVSEVVTVDAATEVVVSEAAVSEVVVEAVVEAVSEVTVSEVKAPEKAAKAQDKAAKEQEKAAKEQEKAAKLAAKEQEKAAKEQEKAAKEQEKAAKLAAKEQENAAKLAAKEQEKAAKEQEKAAKEQEKAAKEQEKAAKLAAKSEAKAKPAEKPAATKAPVNDDTSASDVVKKIEFEGKKYLKSKKTGIVYDYEEYVKSGDQVIVGKWNEATNKLDFESAKSEGEESEDEYDEEE
jgi:hypothetical protein